MTLTTGPFLWDEEERAVREILNALPMADILKVSEEEMLPLTGESDLRRGARKLREQGPGLVLVSRGEFGSFYCAECGTGQMRPSKLTWWIPRVRATLFLSSPLPPEGPGCTGYRPAGQRRSLTIYSILQTRQGAYSHEARGDPSMPTLEEIAACRKNIPRSTCE